MDAVADAVMRARGGLKDPKRPVGSFLFLGPTGVGKTELARALAQFLFDDERAHDPHRHVGVSGEAHGFAAGGRASGIRRLRRGRAVDGSGAAAAVLAWCCWTKSRRRISDVFHVLLQVLDDGRLTDGQGRTVDFKNTIVIMTSNAPKEELPRLFRPEFLNRVDEIITFHRLTEAAVEEDRAKSSWTGCGRGWRSGTSRSS